MVSFAPARRLDGQFLQEQDSSQARSVRPVLDLRNPSLLDGYFGKCGILSAGLLIIIISVFFYYTCKLQWELEEHTSLSINGSKSLIAEWFAIHAIAGIRDNNYTTMPQAGFEPGSSSEFI